MNDIDVRLKQNQRDIERLQEERKRLQAEKEQLNIPRYISVGQVYLFPFSASLFMYCNNGDKFGFTVVGDTFPGCYDGRILVKSGIDVRALLIEKKAKYLGLFNELFTRRQ